MNDRAFEEQLSELYLRPAASTDRSRLVAPTMRRIELDDRRRSLALGASGVAGAVLVIAAVDMSGAGQSVRALAAEVWSMATSLPQAPQLGISTLIVLAAVGLGVSALAATRAAQQL